MATVEDIASNDAAVTAFQTKFQSHYALAIPPQIWQAILAALASLLGGCVTPTPATVKAQASRTIFHVRLWLRLATNGVPAGSIGQAVDAAVASVVASSDDELKALITAATEANQ